MEWTEGNNSHSQTLTAEDDLFAEHINELRRRVGGTLPVFNVMDPAFAGGAKGDGISDDTAAGQAMYDASEAAGGAICVWPKPQSFYRVAGQTAPFGSDYPFTGFIIPSNTISLGAGKKISLLRTDAIVTGAHENYFTLFSNPNLYTGGDENIFFVDMGFDLPDPIENSVAMARYDGIANFYGVSNARFLNCWGKNGGIQFQALRPAINTSTALDDGHNDNNAIDYCEFENVTGSMAFSNATNGRFSYVKVSKAWDDVLLIGSSGRGHRILHCKLSGMGAVSGKGSCSGVISLHNDGGVGNTTDVMSDILIQDTDLLDAATMQLGKRSGVNMFGAMQDIDMDNIRAMYNQWGLACNDGDRKDITVRFSKLKRNTKDGILANANVEGGSIRGVRIIETDTKDNGTSGSGTSGINITANFDAVCEVDMFMNDTSDDELTTQLYGVSVGTEPAAGPKAAGIVKIRLIHNKLNNSAPLHEFGDGISDDSVVQGNEGLADPEVSATESFSVNKTDGNLGVKLRIDGVGRLFVENEDGATAQDLIIGTAFDNDKVVAFRYTPGVVGAGGGHLVIGQIDKNNANYTHGSTALRVNGTDQLTLIDRLATFHGGLNFDATDRAITLPTLTTAQKNALSATNGMVVYDTTLNKFQGYEAGVWTNLI